MQLIIAIIMAIFIYSVQAGFYKRKWDENLDVDIRFEDDWIEAGENSALLETINNAKWLPLPVFHVKFSTAREFDFSDVDNSNVTDLYHRNDAFSVMGNQKVTRRLEFTGKKRGLYFINGLNVTARDFFMTRSFARTVENESFIYVFPSKKRLGDVEDFFSEIMGDINSKKSLLEDPFSFAGLRDYMPYDSIRRINWKASAKKDDIMVNKLDPASGYNLCIIVNMETDNMIRPEALQEMVIELASAAAKFYIDKNVNVSIKTNGIDCLTGVVAKTGYGSSKGHMVTIDKCLSRINGDAGLEAFEEIINDELMRKKHEDAYLIISPYCKEELLVKLDYMRQDSCALKMLVPHYDAYEINDSRDYVRGLEVRLNDL